MSRRRLPESAILELLNEDEEESESELSDQGSETSDHIVAAEPLPAEESTCSDSEEDELPLSEISSCFTGRDKVMKWQISNNNRVRHQVQNILIEDAGICRNGVGVTTFTQAWSLFISENIIEQVVRHTNEFIQKKVPSYNRIRDCKPSDAVEIRALFGLLYIAGSLKTSHANLEDLYASDGTGIPIFPTTMSIKRMKFLLNSLRFDDATTSSSYSRQSCANKRSFRYVYTKLSFAIFSGRECCNRSDDGWLLRKMSFSTVHEIKARQIRHQTLSTSRCCYVLRPKY